MRRLDFVTTHRGPDRDRELPAPGCEPARVRAMYTDPDHARSGIGRLILETCENAAREAGLTEGELLATLAGEPLNPATGWRATERTVVATSSGIDVPAVRMVKQFLPNAR